MSGGSYEYLFCKNASDVLGMGDDEEVLQRMADRLAGIGDAEDAARETTELICMIRQSKVRIETSLRRLSEVWRAVEWWDSGDSGEDGVRAALVRYRDEDNA